MAFIRSLRDWGARTSMEELRERRVITKSLVIFKWRVTSTYSSVSSIFLRGVNRQSLDEAAVQRTEPQEDVLDGHLRVIPYSETIAEEVLRTDTRTLDKILIQYLKIHKPTQLEAFKDALNHRHEIPTILRLLQKIRLGDIFNLLTA